MNILDAFSYYIALLAISLAPGPIILLLVVRAVSNDVKGAIGFSIGTAIGSITILTAVCFGISLWIEAYPSALANSKYLMLAYVMWIARDIWKGGFDMTAASTPQQSGVVWSIGAGFVTCVTSPFMLVLFPLILPQVMDMTTIVMPDFAILTVATLAAEVTVVLVAVGLAMQLRRLARSDNAMLIMNRSLALLLVLGGGAMTLA